MGRPILLYVQNDLIGTSVGALFIRIYILIKILIRSLKRLICLLIAVRALRLLLANHLYLLFTPTNSVNILSHFIFYCQRDMNLSYDFTAKTLAPTPNQAICFMI